MAQAHAHTQHVEPNYMNVFWALAVLTVVEIGVAYIPIHKLAVGAMLVILACAKAALVALYFMHLKFERPTLGIIALTPMILCVFLILMLLPDLTAEDRLNAVATPPAAEATTPSH